MCETEIKIERDGEGCWWGGGGDGENGGIGDNVSTQLLLLNPNGGQHGNNPRS